MDQHAYDPAWVTGFFDSYGDQEWERLNCRPKRVLEFLVHAQILREHLKPGDRVLEVGPGPGRFTQLMAGLGVRIVALDISSVQLDLLRVHAKDEGFESSIEGLYQEDFTDLSEFGDDSYDAVCAIGGPLSYVFEKREAALKESLRVVKPGGFVILGVMSLWGSIHHYLSSVLATSEAESDRLTRSGDHLDDHHCHVFRSEELSQLIGECGGEIAMLSASSALGTCSDEVVEAASRDPKTWEQLVKLEIQACRAPGLLDGGTHIIAVCRKPVQIPT